MGKLALTMSAALLVLGAMAMSANAQSAGAASIHALKNATRWLPRRLAAALALIVAPDIPGFAAPIAAGAAPATEQG
jgi:hypothetical protein